MVLVSGEVDLAARTAFESSINQALAQSPSRLTVDLSGATVLGVSGAAVLALAVRAATAEGATVRLVPGPSHVMRALAVSPFADLLSLDGDDSPSGRTA